MEFRKRRVIQITCAALIAFGGSAQAATINMSLIQSAWGNVVIGNPNTLSGVGTNVITWNMPPVDGDHSAFHFDNAATLSMPTNTAFSLGEFTYFNYPAMGEDLDSADLYINTVLNIDGTVVNANSMSVPFTLHPISGNCGNPNCNRDQIKLTGTQSIGTFNIGGMEYSLDIMGFLTDGKIKSVLHVFDNDQSTASLMAEFRATAIPEPGTLGLLLAGFAGLAWNKRRSLAVRRQNH